uniref:Predicted protein n=1 Tax=Hordeum vulgare subsp. vulgare TaxID=112509 RepID=F2E9T6_HORVV|nr:predicted protein [Hordeum vulgare subsp. vulgare]
MISATSLEFHGKFSQLFFFSHSIDLTTLLPFRAATSWIFLCGVCVRSSVIRASSYGKRRLLRDVLFPGLPITCLR